MQKTTSLMLLVLSLSKAEKRYFRMYSDLQAGNKKYVYLFDLIEAGHPMETVHKKFCDEYSSDSFAMATKHLYHTLVDCLIHLRKNSDVQTKIVNFLSEAGILYERALFDEALDALNKAKKLAALYEIDTLELLARRTELKYLNAIDFVNITERQLVNKQMKIVERMKYSRSANLHSQLYDILKHRLIHKGYSRSEKQKDDLNDLTLSELNLVANDSYKGFETQKLHLLFQATYYLNSGNYKTAIRFYQTLIDLFEQNKQMILNPPVYYTEAIRGILNSLATASLYAEMPFFIQKLKEIAQGNYAYEFTLDVRAHIFLYEFTCTFRAGNFAEAVALASRYEDDLFKNVSSLSLKMQFSLFLNLTVLYLATGDLKNARKNMKHIVSSGKLFYVLPDYRYARLINLLLQAELKNYDFFENEIKSIKRSIRYEKQVYATEKLLFKFILQYHLLDSKTVRERFLKQLRKESEKILRNKYERPILDVFDFIAWMESKVSGRDFQEIITGRKEFSFNQMSISPSKTVVAGPVIKT